MALIAVAAAACSSDGSTERFQAHFDQGATVPSDREVSVTATRDDRGECRLSGRAKFNPATERIEIEFHTMSCDGNQKSFSAIALDKGESLIGVQAQCAAGKESESAKKPYVCLSGKVVRGQAFTVVAKL